MKKPSFEFVVIKLALKGKIKGIHPGFKPCTLVNDMEIAEIDCFDTALDYAISTFSHGNFHAGIENHIIPFHHSVIRFMSYFIAITLGRIHKPCTLVNDMEIAEIDCEMIPIT